MCVVSAVVGGWTDPTGPNYVPFTPTYPPPDLARQMLDVLKKLEDLDKRLGAIDCKLEAQQKKAIKRKLERRARSNGSPKKK